MIELRDPNPWKIGEQLSMYLADNLPIEFESPTPLQFRRFRLKPHVCRNVWRRGSRQPTRRLNWFQWREVAYEINKFLDEEHLHVTVTALGGRMVIREGFIRYDDSDWMRQIGYELIGPAQLPRFEALVQCPCRPCLKKEIWP